MLCNSHLCIDVAPKSLETRRLIDPGTESSEALPRHLFLVFAQASE
jgi:hypothetical protein